MERNHKGLLIYPPSQLMNIETPRPDGSLGLLYLAAALEAKGIKTDILDASVGTSEHSLKDTFYRSIKQNNGLTRIGMGFQEIADYVVKSKYSFVGINSNLTPQTRMVFETAKAIKKANPKVKVFTGGVNARALKERFLKTGYFDGICLTEGELIFPRMITEELKSIPGVAFNYNGNMVVNPVDSSCFPKELDQLPVPAWEKLPLDKYEKVASPHGVDVTNSVSAKYAPIMTSRGCRFGCLYCHISTEKENIGKLRLHSVKRVTEEVEILKSLGVKRLFFEDDSLFAMKNRAKELFTIVKDRNISISNVNGVNLIDFYKPKTNNKEGKWEIDTEFIELLKEAGFEQLVFPAESGSQRIQDKYASKKVILDKMDLPLLMKAITDIGIKAPVNIMIGFPDETEEEMQQSIDLAGKLMDSGASYVTFFIPIPFPGSQLFNIAIKEGYLDRNFDTDLMNWKRPVMKNTKVAPNKLEEIRDKANESINTKSHIKKRLKDSIGHRRQSS